MCPDVRILYVSSLPTPLSFLLSIPRFVTFLSVFSAGYVRTEREARSGLRRPAIRRLRRDDGGSWRVGGHRHL
jgi:hypothetical protein